jgi:DNA-binding LacI/PurR family transcriptional regulator
MALLTKTAARHPEKVTLKAVGKYVGLTAGTVSQILNRTPQSMSMPLRTRNRVLAAARKLNYQPNLYARALRSGRVPALSSTQTRRDSRALVFAGPEHFLRAVNAIRRAGLRVPGDVSIAGIDDISALGDSSFGA